MRHLISLFDLSTSDVGAILDLALELKRNLKAGERRHAILEGHVLTQLFEKPSLRTRASFDAAIVHLGGSSQFMSSKEAGLEGRESLADVARVVSSFSDAVVLRTFSQKLIEEFAEHASCPVINGLSDDCHPCQALTDLLTLREVFGNLNGLKLVYVGDGNNVAASLAVAAAMTELELTVCAPESYQLPESFLTQLKSAWPDVRLVQSTDPKQAVGQADVVYTDVWASMGQEEEASERKRVFAPYQVNAELMAAAPDGCKFMHDLPARRGLEVTDDVIDGPNSIVFQQAENRMHLAKGLLVWLMKESSGD